MDDGRELNSRKNLIYNHAVGSGVCGGELVGAPTLYVLGLPSTNQNTASDLCCSMTD